MELLPASSIRSRVYKCGFKKLVVSVGIHLFSQIDFLHPARERVDGCFLKLVTEISKKVEEPHKMLINSQDN